MGNVAGFVLSRLSAIARERGQRHRLPAALPAASYARVAASTGLRNHVVVTAAPAGGAGTADSPGDLGVEDAIHVHHPDELAPHYVAAGGGTFYHRTAHTIWELRQAIDGDGYVLVRKREERLPDCRRDAARVASAAAAGLVNVDAFPFMTGMPGLPSGFQQPTMPAVVIVEMAPPDPGKPAADEDPFERGRADGGHGGDGEAGADADTELERDHAAHQASLVRQVRLAVQLEQALRDRWLVAGRSFRPELHGGRGMVEAGQVYKVEGFHRADPTTDTHHGVPHPALPYPSARPEHWDLNARVRLAPVGGGPLAFVTLRELDLFFAPAARQDIADAQQETREGYDPVPEMPGEAVPPGAMYPQDETSLYPTRIMPADGVRAAARARTSQSGGQHGSRGRRARRALQVLPGAIVRVLDNTRRVLPGHAAHVPGADRSDGIPATASAVRGGALRPRLGAILGGLAPR